MEIVKRIKIIGDCETERLQERVNNFIECTQEEMGSILSISMTHDEGDGWVLITYTIPKKAIYHGSIWS